MTHQKSKNNIKVILLWALSIGVCVFLWLDFTKAFISQIKPQSSSQHISTDSAKAFAEQLQMIDPALDITLKAADYYERGSYEKAEYEAKKAIAAAYQRPPIFLAHTVLFDIYMATGKYKLAIKEIDWFLRGTLRDNPKNAKNVRAKEILTELIMCMAQSQEGKLETISPKSMPKEYDINEILPPYKPEDMPVGDLQRGPLASLGCLVDSIKKYKETDYVESEYWAIKALEFSRHLWIHRLAHRWLALIYEAGGRPDLAIKELDWLLEHSNKYTKPDLVKWKKRLKAQVR